MRKAIALALSATPLLAAACVKTAPTLAPRGEPDAAIETPVQASPQDPSTVRDPVVFESMRLEMRAYFCEPSSILRVCFAVPDDATCTALFDEKWPGCTVGIQRSVAPDNHNREEGRVAGRCVASAFAERFERTESVRCREMKHSAEVERATKDSGE
jgi:hypothetical protein